MSKDRRPAGRLFLLKKGRDGREIGLKGRKEVEKKKTTKAYPIAERIGLGGRVGAKPLKQWA